MRREALLVLQGGGAMGAFQCGAYRAIAAYLREHDIQLAGVAGTSIGALNGAMIARHYRDADRGAAALERLWRERLAVPPVPFFPFPSWYWNCWNGLLTSLLCGHPNLFTPNYAAWNALTDSVRTAAPFYFSDATERLLTHQVGDYGPNPGGSPLLLVRGIDAATQQATAFHSWNEAITPRHLRASISIPLMFAPAEIDGRRYWDGEFSPRTVLHDLLHVLQSQRAPERAHIGEYLVIVVDLFRGERHTPRSALDLSYQVLAGMLEAKADIDADFAERNNRYLDFLSALERDSPRLPDSPIKERIVQEHRRATQDGLCKLRIVRVDRTALPDEHVSRDFDYSPWRMRRLIEQGYQSAIEALSATAPVREARHAENEKKSGAALTTATTDE